jgi:protease-4
MSPRRQRYGLLLALGFLLGTVSAAEAAAIPRTPGPLIDLHDEFDFVPQTAGASVGAPAGWINPAAWAVPVAGESAIWWDDRDLRSGALDDWGFALCHNFGFALNTQVYPGGDGETRRLTDYQLGVAGGGGSSYWGFAYRWSGGGPREPSLALGWLDRPLRQLSVGLTGQTSVRSAERQLALDAGVRPLGSDVVTLNGAYVLGTTDRIDDGRWRAGVQVRPVRGLHLGGDWIEGGGVALDRLRLEIGVALDGISFHALPSTYEGGDRDRVTYLVRMNPPFRGLPIAEELWPAGSGGPQFVAIDLENKRLTYQKYRWFDDVNVPWLDLAGYLDAVARDPHVDGVALNLIDLQTTPAVAWELHVKLSELRRAGKEIVVAIGEVDMTTYALATVADRIFLDPDAVVALPGVALYRTYLRNLLDKLGVGVQELRYFTYKSAAEGLARINMSAADREQRQRIADVQYGTVRDLTTATRPLGPADFDRIVDEQVLVLPEQAVAAGLVDTLGRWPDLQEWIGRERGGRFVALGRNYRPWLFPEEQWGDAPRIAVIYLRGVCAMDSGIRGRAAGAYLRGLIGDDRVSAVVLRVDSPGGSGLASERVAAAVRALKDAGKPVIVSQGNVAASGGYWLSMDGTEILTTPVTVTGSIGVIAVWLYDDGFGEKVGLSDDGVQVGKHADVFANLRLPLLGTGPAIRALDEGELELVRGLILTDYDRFVAKVAAGRGLDEARVRELGEGRVWMGGDAIERGLCDRIGTLPEAVEIARARAGLSPATRIAIVEFPPRPLINLPSFGPKLPDLFGFLEPVLSWLASADGGAPAVADEDEALRDYLELLAGQAGRPLAILPPDFIGGL